MPIRKPRGAAALAAQGDLFTRRPLELLELELELPGGVVVELSPMQAGWILPLRASNAGDARASSSCDGCAVFGLCITHGGAR